MRKSFIANIIALLLTAGCVSKQPSRPTPLRPAAKTPPTVPGMTAETFSAMSLAPSAPAAPMPITRILTAAWDGPVVNVPSFSNRCETVLYWSPLLYGNGEWREVGRYKPNVRKADVLVPWPFTGQFGITLALIP